MANGLSAKKKRRSARTAAFISAPIAGRAILVQIPNLNTIRIKAKWVVLEKLYPISTKVPVKIVFAITVENPKRLNAIEHLNQ